MKKRNLKSLKLNKKLIVDMNSQKTLKGGKTGWACWVSFRHHCPQ
ncbi:hypothetical protein [Kordia sp.]